MVCLAKLVHVSMNGLIKIRIECDLRHIMIRNHQPFVILHSAVVAAHYT